MTTFQGKDLCIFHFLTVHFHLEYLHSMLGLQAGTLRSFTLLMGRKKKDIGVVEKLRREGVKRVDKGRKRSEKGRRRGQGRAERRPTRGRKGRGGGRERAKKVPQRST